MGLAPPATLIEFNSMKFLIANSPEIFSIQGYVKQLLHCNARKLLKACESVYDQSVFAMVGITIEELLFADGSFPTIAIIDRWIDIIKQYFQTHPKATLAVHCQSGLGRSPVLIAIALMESGMKPQQAIDFIRTRRRGVFNAQQTAQIRQYKSKNRLQKY